MASRKTRSVTPKEDSRLSRIRENQRRSRARKREYIEDLEGRWKKCQELGVQANVELQKAAQRVIEENTLLRRILADLGLETAQVDNRLKELKETISTDGNCCNISGGDNGCGVICTGKLDGTPEDIIAPFSESEPPLASPESALPTESIEEDPMDLSRMNTIIPHASIDGNASPSTLQTPLFETSLLETTPDYESMFDMTQFLEPFDLPLTTSGNSSAVPDPQVSLSPDSIMAQNLPTPTSMDPLAQACNHTSSKSRSKNTTSCSEAYALLKALNAQRQEQKDMLQIVLELWIGFCPPEPGEEEGKGCRVDNDVLQKAIDQLK